MKPRGKYSSLEIKLYPIPEKKLSIYFPKKSLWVFYHRDTKTYFYTEIRFCLYFARFSPYDSFLLLYCCYNLGSTGRINVLCSTISLKGKKRGKIKSIQSICAILHFADLVLKYADKMQYHYV